MPDADNKQSQATEPSDADKKRREEYVAWQQKDAQDRAAAAEKAREEAETKAKPDDADKSKDDQEQPAKRGPGRPPKDKDKEKPVYEGEDVTYTPSPHDSPRTKWRGIDFEANKPVRIKNMEHIEAIRGNPFFRVGDEDQAKDPNKEPEDAMGYRAHVIGWMRHMSTIEQVCQKWSSEKNLREKCEVGEDDVKYLGTMIESRLKQMRMQEAKTEIQVAEMWMRYGTLDLPWRAA